MRLDRIEQMADVLRALYDKEYRAVRDILAQESKLRSDLKRLNEQIAINRGTCANHYQLQAVGAQLLWQGWTARTRSQLNTELAQIMAKKLVTMDRVRVAFGRQRAIEMMQTARHLEARQQRTRQQELALLGIG